MNRFILFAAGVLSLVSCEKWNDYTTDYDYSAVYFAHQNQLRTLVAEDPMSFEFGVYLAGKRENTAEEWAKYRIEPELLEDRKIVGNRKFELIPADCYTLSSPDIFNIHEGSFLGTSKITFDIEKFTSLPGSDEITYALPVRVYETSADSILVGKTSPEGSIIVAPMDYAVIAVRYINPYHGNYYLKGTRYIEEGGEYKVDETYDQKDLSKNKVIAVSTDDLHTSETAVAGGISSSGGEAVGLSIYVSAGLEVSLSKSADASSIISFTDLGSSYVPESRTFNLKYSFSTSDENYKVEEQLIWRDTELKFEQW